MKISSLLPTVLGLLLAAPAFAADSAPPASAAAPAPIELRLVSSDSDPVVPDAFVGLSFEMQRLLPDAEGKHFFRPDHTALLTLFRTLGVKCLRIGGNTADRPTLPFPSLADIDACFAFARAAKVKVIFTLRLREGDPRLAGAVAKNIVEHHADVLWCFAIGNEPNVFAPEYPVFLAAWKKFADVVNSPEFAPAARFAGPSSTAAKNGWTRDFAQEFAGTGRLRVATQHIYPGGNADLQKDPAEARRLMLSREWVDGYQKFHDGFVPGVLATKTPYRLGETNSFWNGGRAEASNTFTAALWALDYQHWWAQHGANGLNFHTGDHVAKSETNTHCMYSAFWSVPAGFEAKPVAYALKAFSLGARGEVGRVEITTNPQEVNLTAYVTRSTSAGDATSTLTLINKDYGPGAHAAEVTVPAAAGAKIEVLRLETPDGDIAREAGFTLGGATIEADGTWRGRWTVLGKAVSDGRLVVRVPAASAILLRWKQS